jgi:hypothetical protein
MAAETLEQPKPRVGSRTRARAVVAQAMLERGESYRTVQKETGLAYQTIANIKRHNLVPREDIENVKRSLQDKYTLAANEFLDAARTKEKLKETKAADLMRMSALAFDRSGLATSPIDSLVDALSKYQKKATAVPKVVNASPADYQSIDNRGTDTGDKTETT